MRFIEALVLLAFATASAEAEESLTIATWGGPYESAQRTAIFEPFTQKTGISINVRQYDGLPQTVEKRATKENWDLLDMEEDQAIASCNAGHLAPIDPKDILTSDAGDVPKNEFVEGSFRECSIAQNLFATVVAFHDQAFPGVKPDRIQDFFDLESFPGRRAIQRSPDAILEWALMAEGVPASQVYDLLSTDRGLRLALRRLDQIRESIIWWEDVAEPVALLRSGSVSMASGFNGRFFSAAHNEGIPISIIWDGRIIGHEVWAIYRESKNADSAKDFIKFATEPSQLAALAEIIPYGPARITAIPRIGTSEETGVPMRLHIPNSPLHGGRSLTRDSVWYARTRDFRARRFNLWLEGGSP